MARKKKGPRIPYLLLRLGRLKVVNLKPGDRLILETKGPLNCAQLEAVTEQFERNLPGVRPIILEQLTAQAVLRKTEK